MTRDWERVERELTTEAVTGLLCDLIRIPSMNNFGDASLDGEEYREEAVARFVADYFASTPCTVRFTEVLPGRPNLTVTLPGRREEKVLVFEAHTDTVQSAAMEIPPFDPVVTGGRVYGLGACDTKGSLAAMMLALKAVSSLAEPPECTIVLAATMDEEYLHRGVTHLLEQGFRAAGAVVGEPTGLELVIAHKGCVRWRVETVGRAAHSSRPQDGINAVMKMVRVLAMIESELIPECHRTRHPLVGSPSFNVGTIRGGVQSNIVPDRCVIDIDRRMIPGENAEAILADFRRRLDELARREPDFQFVVHPPYLVDPALETSPSASIVRVAQEVCAELAGRGEVAGVPYGTDASKFACAGIPAIVLGPGSIAQAHSAREFVPVDELLQAARIYARLMLRFTG